MKAGHTSPGYYFVDGKDETDELLYDVVKCNMDLEPSNPKFQEPTTKAAEFPVIFDAMRNTTSYSTPGTVIQYEHMLTNVGEAMTTAGTFTAPQSGVYFFAFYFIDSLSDKHNTVYIRVNGVTAAAVDVYDSILHRVPGSAHVAVFLEKGNKVDAYLHSGSLWVDSVYAYVHFTGFLLHAM